MFFWDILLQAIFFQFQQFFRVILTGFPADYTLALYLKKEWKNHTFYYNMIKGSKGIIHACLHAIRLIINGDYIK